MISTATRHIRTLRLRADAAAAFRAPALQTLIRYIELVVLFRLFMAVASPTSPAPT